MTSPIIGSIKPLPIFPTLSQPNLALTTPLDANGVLLAVGDTVQNRVGIVGTVRAINLDGTVSLEIPYDGATTLITLHAQRLAQRPAQR